MAHPHHCLVTQKLQSTYFNVLYVYFIIGPNVRSHYGGSDEWLSIRWNHIVDGGVGLHDEVWTETDGLDIAGAGSLEKERAVC